MKQFKRAELISSANITPLVMDDDYFQAEVSSPNDTYLVSCIDGLWRCSCHDYTYRGVGHEESSYNCKHILAVILDMHDNPERYEDEQSCLNADDFVDAHELFLAGDSI